MCRVLTSVLNLFCAGVALGFLIPMHLLAAEGKNISSKQRSQPTLPRCIGGFCVTGQSPKELKAFFEKYGSGSVKVFGNDSNHCYFDKTQRLHVQIDEGSGHVNELIVSRKPLCDHPIEPKLPLPLLATESGVGVGDSSKKVFEVYGKPGVDSKYPPESWSVVETRIRGYEKSPAETRDLIEKGRKDYQRQSDRGTRSLSYGTTRDDETSGLNIYLMDDKVSGFIFFFY